MRAVIVGAGATARDLVRRLGDSWDVVVVDTQAERIEATKRIRDVETIVGDGSSAVILKQAQIERAAVVVAASGSDDVNIEVVRLAAAADVDQVVALLRSPQRRGEYADYDVQIVTPASLSARALEVAMEPRKVTSTTFAEGKAEAIELVITPDSPVEGKALKEIHSELWVIAAILREGSLIVPHGTTRLLRGDRVTVVSTAASYQQVVRTFSGGVSRFPLNFGQNVVVAMEDAADREGVVVEAADFVRNSNAEGLTIVFRDPESIRGVAEAEQLSSLVESLTQRALGVEVVLRPTSGSLDDAIRASVEEESIGTIAVSMRPRTVGHPFSGIPSALNTLIGLAVPVLFTRGERRFSEVITPATRTMTGDTSGRAAIDVAKRAGTPVVGVAVANPLFMGADDAQEKRRATAWLRREAAVQDVEVRRHVVRGNPVKVLADMSTPESLLVLSMPRRPIGKLKPGTAVWAASRGEGSVLFVPSED